LEAAKTALSRLQEMVERIEPDQRSTSPTHLPSMLMSTKETTKKDDNDDDDDDVSSNTRISQSQTASKMKTSVLSRILSPTLNEPAKSTVTLNSYADVKMAAQHREIERLVESRQRLHTIKDQIASLHQTMQKGCCRFLFRC
jgi:hypothetical protein